MKYNTYKTCRNNFKADSLTDYVKTSNHST